jgi:hypothetical protein
VAAGCGALRRRSGHWASWRRRRSRGGSLWPPGGCRGVGRGGLVSRLFLCARLWLPASLDRQIPRWYPVDKPSLYCKRSTTLSKWVFSDIFASVPVV